jgi:hypothetical protein
MMPRWSPTASERPRGFWLHCNALVFPTFENPLKPGGVAEPALGFSGHDLVPFPDAPPPSDLKI